MKTIAILNEKGGTAKTTTSVSLSAALGSLGKKVLLVDLDGQAASSRWLGVEGDTRLADALLEGSGLVPIENVIPGVSLAPASGKLDSISHNLRPTQGSQLRRVLAEVKDRYDYILIDCPPSLGNRLIGNALLAASHAIVPVETSILALDGLRILLTMLDDIRQGFEHEIELIGALGCRFNSRTRLSRLVLAELHRALPDKVFGTVIHETVRMQECPASGKSILEYAPDCSAAKDYLALAGEVVNGILPCTIDLGVPDIIESDEVDHSDRRKISNFRERAGKLFNQTPHQSDTDEELNIAETPQPAQEPQPEASKPEPELEPEPVEPEEPKTSKVATYHSPSAPRSVDITLTPQEIDEESPAADTTPEPMENARPEPQTEQKPAKPLSFDQEQKDQPAQKTVKFRKPSRSRDNLAVGVAAAVLLGILGIGGWVGFKAIMPSPESASARPAPPAPQITRNAPTPRVDPSVTAPTESVEAAPLAPSTSKPESAKPATMQQLVSTETEQPLENENARTLRIASDATNEEDSSNAENKLPPDTESKSKPEPAPTTQPHTKASTVQPAPRRQATPEDYPVGLSLTAIMYGKTSRRAIISGKVAYEGETILGAKIVKILPDAVEVEANGFRFVLGTGPKPVWLKATQVLPPKDKEPDNPPAENDSTE